MIESIQPIKDFPDNIILDGDYNTTQSALILGFLSEGDVVINNYNKGIDTSHTAALLTSLGCSVTITDERITINKSDENDCNDCIDLTYLGGMAPLCMLIGLMAGRNRSCCLYYSDEINPDGVEKIVMFMNKYGLDISNHDPAHLGIENKYGGVLVFRESELKPIECRLGSAYAHFKNCLLIYGLASGCSISFQEDFLTPDYSKKMIIQLNGKIEVTEAKQVWVTDPDDPRKRTRVNDIGCAREERLPASSSLKGGEIDVPGDLYGAMALLTLAVLKKTGITIKRALLNRSMMKLLNYLKSSGAEFEIEGRTIINGRVIGTLNLKGKKLKGRKVFGRQAAGLIDSVPFLALMASVADSTTIIRDIEEYTEFSRDALSEIASGLNLMDIKTGVLEDGIVIETAKELNGADFKPCANREMALTFYMAALAGVGKSSMAGFDKVKQNYPLLTGMLHPEVETVEVIPD
jgi:3-phosphoshikimate 1-carboxyvinyltransferase